MNNCINCEYMEMHESTPKSERIGHCYMFETEPKFDCMQFSPIIIEEFEAYLNERTD